MDITPLGHASFRIRGKHTTVVTDPYDSGYVGLKFPKHTSADIVTVSHGHHDHNKKDQIEGSPYIVSGAGEYEIKGTSIIGLSTFHDEKNGKERGSNTIYRIDMDGISIAHLGDLGHTLAAAIVDVLLIPVGGIYTIDAHQAAEVVSEIDPKIVIPMHYGRKELNQKQFSTLAPVSVFLKETGKDPVAPQNKLSISKDKLPAEMLVVVLE